MRDSPISQQRCQLCSSYSELRTSDMRSAILSAEALMPDHLATIEDSRDASLLARLANALRIISSERHSRLSSIICKALSALDARIRSFFKDSILRSCRDTVIERVYSLFMLARYFLISFKAGHVLGTSTFSSFSPKNIENGCSTFFKDSGKEILLVPFGRLLRSIVSRPSGSIISEMCSA